MQSSFVVQMGSINKLSSRRVAVVAACCCCHVPSCCLQLRATMQQDLQNMKAVFRQTVFEKAPGARS